METEIEVNQSRKVYSVSELTRVVRFTLEDKFPTVWVEGEVSNFTHHSSGHMYFSLKDASSTLPCVMFRQENARLRFKPADGMKVTCRGRVTIYAQHGKYQLLLDAMEPKGVGELQVAFEQLKKKLGDEGLFDAARKRPIPYLPATIGIVTSLTGAVIRDMIHVFNRRFAECHLLIAPVQVQGDTAKHEIVQAIQELNRHGRCDVIVLARGGGSLEDLWAFNEEIVARAIAASRIPVVSAVGHEVDYTIADFVASLRAPTPSAAAEILLPEKRELMAEIERLSKYLYKAASGRIDALRAEVEAVRAARALRSPQDLFTERAQGLDELGRNLKRQAARAAERAGERLAALAGRLGALSPLACLARGYTITFGPDGHVLKSARRAQPGQTIRTRFPDGSVTSRVEKITEGHPRVRQRTDPPQADKRGSSLTGFPHSRE